MGSLNYLWTKPSSPFRAQMMTMMMITSKAKVGKKVRGRGKNLQVKKTELSLQREAKAKLQPLREMLTAASCI